MGGQNGDTEAMQSPSKTLIEVNATTDEDLETLVSWEGLNKTTIVNRAVQLYRLLVQAIRDDCTIHIVDRSGKATSLNWE